jgi:hypothetical protein
MNYQQNITLTHTPFRLNPVFPFTPSLGHATAISNIQCQIYCNFLKNFTVPSGVWKFQIRD